MYKCAQCGREFSQPQKNGSDDCFPWYGCPECGSESFLMQQKIPKLIKPEAAISNMLWCIMWLNKALCGTLNDNPSEKLGDARYALVQFIEQTFKGAYEDRLYEIGNAEDIKSFMEFLESEREEYREI